MNDNTYVENPEAIGNPELTPRVRASSGLMALLRPCQQTVASKGGEACGGVNGYHMSDCPNAESKLIDPYLDEDA